MAKKEIYTGIWKRTLLLISFSIIILSFTQNTIHKPWDANSPLTWDDYQGSEKNPDFNDRIVSHTLCGEQWYPRRLKTDSNTYKFAFFVKCVMAKKQSWVHPDYKTPELLKHEQLHFDIAEYFARQLLLALQNGTYSSNYREEMNAIRHKITVQRTAMQDLYDEQTKHSTNIKMQAKWNSYVAMLLSTNVSLNNALQELPNKKN